MCRGVVSDLSHNSNNNLKLKQLIIMTLNNETMTETMYGIILNSITLMEN